MNIDLDYRHNEYIDFDYQHLYNIQLSNQHIEYIGDQLNK